MDEDPTEQPHQRKRRQVLVSLMLGLVGLTLLASGLVFVLAVSSGQSLYAKVGPVTFVSFHTPVIMRAALAQMGGSNSNSSNSNSSSSFYTFTITNSSSCKTRLSGAIGDGLFYVTTC